MRSNCAWITIYNVYTNPATRQPAYQRVTVPDVTWENRRAANKSAAGEIAANKATIYILLTRCANYLNPRAWQALPVKTGKWTLQDGDVIVRALATEELTGAFTVTALKAKYDDCLTITSVDLMDLGSSAIRHYQVEGS